MIRPLTPEDKPMLESWIASEPEHKNNTWDWYNEAGAKSVVFEDAEGAVLVAKFTPSLKIDIDFLPEGSPKRIAGALSSGLAEMGSQAKQQGFKQVSFDSVSDKLRAFCERLGFVESPEMRKIL